MDSTMTMKKLALALYSYFYILQLASETHGEITPPWITFRGCYAMTNGSRNTNLPDNSPTNCFKECANLKHIGILNDLCVCFETLLNMSRKPEVFCRSGQSMLIYSKVIELPFNINQADYGYMYVSIQNVPISIIFHASNDSSENHGVICIEDFSWSCVFRRGAANNVNGETAESTCSLVSYFDFNNSCRTWQDGDYWIGMFRKRPVESSTYTSTLLSSSTQQTSYVSDSIVVTVSQTDPIVRSTIKLTPSPITETSSAYLITDVTTSLPASPKGEPEDIWKKMAISFITLSLLLTIVIIAGIAAYLRGKKEIHISHADEENQEIQNTNSSHTKKEARFETKGNHTAEIHAQPVTLSAMIDMSTHEVQKSGNNKGLTEERRNEVNGQIPDVFKIRKRIKRSENVDDVGQNPGSPTEERQHKETDGTNELDTAVARRLLNNVEDNNIDTKKKKKKRKKKKKKKKSKKSKNNCHSSFDETDSINVS